MIVEMQTWQLNPGVMPKFEPLLEAALAKRAHLTKPIGVWRTEIGVLNRVITFWPYESVESWERIRAATEKDTAWRADLDEFIVGQESMLLFPAPFTPSLQPQASGPVYEIRTYTYRSGALPDVFEAWGASIDERAKLSPFVGAWYAQAGSLNRWVHVWAYRDLNERERIRGDSVKKGLWPPKNKPGTFVRQESMIVTPFRFSSLQ